MRQPVLVPNNFPAPAASRDLEARVHTAIRGPTFLFGDTGDSFRTMRDSPQKGPHRLNNYITNLRVYARGDGQLEIRFNIVPDEGDTFIWPSQIPARLFVRLFDQNGTYLTHFMTRESFAPAESIVRELTTGAIGLVNRSPVLLLDSDGKTNVLVYTVNARDLDYARIVEVGLYLRPVDASDFGAPATGLPRNNCSDYLQCLVPVEGLRSPIPNATAAPPAVSAPPSSSVPGAVDTAASSLVQWLAAEARWFREREEATSAQKAACSVGKAQECDKFRESLEEIVDRYKRVRDRAGQARTGSLTRASPRDLEEVDKLLKTIGDHVRQSM